MNRLSRAERAQVIRCLVEGNSIRSTSRMTGIARNTITTLLVALGRACSDYQDRTLRNLGSDRIECDETWAFCHAKAKNVPEEHRDEFGWGDVWTWVALDPDSKLVATWLVGRRDADDCQAFLLDLAARLRNRVQLTTDGHHPYLEAVEKAFGSDIDYAMLIKFYGTDPDEPRKFSPPVVLSEEVRIIQGDPDPDRISTSYIERQNLTMRMGMRRFTRLTNAFSKKVENHAAAVALHYMHYNFGRVHSSLGKLTTPAIAAGVSDHVWSCDEIAGLVED
ncbi:MAG: IS1 family transposase [Candidatus Limnocylindrales bacterium]